jgi:hypothetical protein
VLLPGTSMRWHKRTKAWREGWRNLHHAEAAAVTAEPIVGGAGPLSASRTWAADAELIRRHGHRLGEERQSHAARCDGLASAIDTLRPLLSDNELGSIVGGWPRRDEFLLRPATDWLA